MNKVAGLWVVKSGNRNPEFLTVNRTWGTVATACQYPNEDAAIEAAAEVNRNQPGVGARAQNIHYEPK